MERLLAQGKARRKELQETIATLRARFAAQERKQISYFELAELFALASRKINRVDFNGRRSLFERLGVKVFLDGKDNIEIQVLFDPKTNTFVDEPIPFNYREYEPSSGLGKEQEDDDKKAPLQDYRRAHGFRRRPARR